MYGEKAPQAQHQSGILSLAACPGYLGDTSLESLSSLPVLAHHHRLVAHIGHFISTIALPSMQYHHFLRVYSLRCLQGSSPISLHGGSKHAWGCTSAAALFTTCAFSSLKPYDPLRAMGHLVHLGAISCSSVLCMLHSSGYL